MLCIYEFEVFEDDGWFVVLPYDLPGGTQGADYKEACEMAADWLLTEMSHRIIHDIEIPEATFGNAPREGAANIVVVVDVDKDSIRAVSPSEAARMLGVTPGRITQMMDVGKLESFARRGRRVVTLASIEARQEQMRERRRERLASS